MIADVTKRLQASRLWMWGIVAGVLLAAMFFSQRASVRWLQLIAAGFGALALLRKPQLGLLAVIAAALAVPMEISTGTEVRLNLATMLIPLLFALWLLEGWRRRDLRWTGSQIDRPLLLFLGAGLLSLGIGNATWDPAVPKAGNFWVVQLAQWAIFAIAAAAFWLTGNLIEDEIWLQRLTFAFLALGGCLAVARVVPGPSSVARQFSTIALDRAPFWMLLTALAGGQLLFRTDLTQGQRLPLVGLLGAIAFYAFVLVNESRSTWVGVAAAAGILAWLRWPRLRWPVIGLLAALTVSGVTFSTVWEFAGGEEAWAHTGAPRLLLIRHVVQVAIRNPVTGLGPASYRPYANNVPFLMAPGRVWPEAVISSHNNYIDLFAHTGIVGLTTFSWFAVAVARLGLRLRQRFTQGFVAGYVNGMLAAGAASLVIMLMGDWILPFVYNIGFPGFQAAIPVWLFLGGLVAIDGAVSCK